MRKQWMMVMVLVGLLWPCADGVAEDMDMSIFADILYPSKVYYFFSSGKIAKVWPKNAFKRFLAGEEFENHLDTGFSAMLTVQHDLHRMDKSS